MKPLLLFANSFESDQESAGAGWTREIGGAWEARHFVTKPECFAREVVNAEGGFASEIFDSYHFDLHGRFGWIGGVGAVEESLTGARGGEARVRERETNAIDFLDFLTVDYCGCRLPDAREL